MFPLKDEEEGYSVITNLTTVFYLRMISTTNIEWHMRNHNFETSLLRKTVIIITAAIALARTQMNGRSHHTNDWCTPNDTCRTCVVGHLPLLTQPHFL